jgi:hypothetical protein
MKKRNTVIMPTAAQLLSAMGHNPEEILQPAPVAAKKTPAYRKAALDHYRRMLAGNHVNVCVVCGFGIPSVLEIAHLNQDRKDNSLENLAVLCPNCHKMHDIGLLPTEVVRQLCHANPLENWALRMKDAGPKAAEKRSANRAKAAKTAAAKKAWATRAAKPKTKVK